MRSIWAAVLVALALLWADMVLGIEFIAVPAQFSAAGLSPPLGIDITRHVFATFTRVELGLAALTLIVAALGRPGRLLLLLLAVLGWWSFWRACGCCRCWICAPTAAAGPGADAGTVARTLCRRRDHQARRPDADRLARVQAIGERLTRRDSLKAGAGWRLYPRA
jgi:hypothetical protein